MFGVAFGFGIRGGEGEKERSAGVVAGSRCAGSFGDRCGGIARVRP